MVPSIEADDLDAVRRVLSTGYLVQGDQIAEFERRVAEQVGAAHAVAMSNGTAALHLALLALGVGRGDEVLVSAYSWPASANVIELCGARPRFVDVRADTFNMDPAALADALQDTAGRTGRLKAIMPVHAFGQLADMAAIMSQARAAQLPVVEDAACAIGASLYGRQAGSWGMLGCFSFHPRKAITTGEGGVVTTDDPSLARTLRALRNHGLDPDAEGPDFVMPGFNYRMTEFQGALGITQMGKLQRVIAARRKLAAEYDRLLAGTVVTVPSLPPGHLPVHQSYVVLLPAGTGARRGELVSALRNCGIETTIGTWHIPLTRYYRERYGYKYGDFPGCDAVFERALTLPLHEHMTQEQQEQVVSSLLDRL